MHNNYLSIFLRSFLEPHTVAIFCPLENKAGLSVFGLDPNCLCLIQLQGRGDIRLRSYSISTLYIYQPIYPSIYLTFYLSIYIFICLISYIFICISIYLYVLYIYLSIQGAAEPDHPLAGWLQHLRLHHRRGDVPKVP